MVVTVVTWIVYLAGAYLALGVVAALALHIRGLRAIDHATIGAPISFRVLITPGLIALWPIMLSKWRKAARGEDPTGNSNAPLRATQLRRLHGIAIRALALLLPLAIGTAVIARTPITLSHSVGPLEDPIALPQIVMENPAPFGRLPILLRVRTDGRQAWQIELDAPLELDTPALGLYWADASSKSTAPGTSVYLGNVWGPGPRRFAIDGAKLAEGGSLLLYSFIDADLKARADIKVSS